ncbi:uncharacterized protein LOC121736763 [Aricia agestis]|uniref:uncharacterized protein LOC121736763 n=1 Tax=Aricia agestis TaxID=91739 RepID=UPI001C20B642|nr:uncharacterized protein LOC121736763 [Aricia agestis]
MEGIIRVQKHIKIQILNDYENFQGSNKGKVTRSHIKVRLESLEKAWSRFEDNNYELIEMGELPHDSEYLTDKVFDKIKEVYYEYKGELEDILLKEVIDPTVSSTKVRDTLSINLPTINLPTFSGRYTEWPSFRNLFETLIHKNPNLHNIEKLYYLKSHITGEAEQLLRHVPITEASYEDCWKLLRKRYSNKRFIANHTLNRLFGQKNLTSEESCGIKGILDTTNECLSALSNLEIDISTWDLLIIYLVTQKLDGESRKLWEHNISKDLENLPTLDEFYTFLENRFRALEFLELRERKTIVDQRQKTHAFATTAVIMQCSYCKMNHTLDQCTSFYKEDFDTRLQFIRNNNLCFNCFSTYHKASSCRRLRACQRCNGRHHTLLHRETIARCGLPKTGIWPLDEVHGESNYYNNDEVKNRQLPQVMLPTALVKVNTENSSTTLKALLDQGSQASIVTERMAEILSLQRIPVEGAVTGVGGEDQNVAIKEMVEFNIQSTASDFNCNVQAYVLSDLPSTPAVEVTHIVDWPELSSLKLADPRFDKPGKIDVILGAEIYGRILRYGILRDTSYNLTAQNTHFGWILSGRVPVMSQEFKVG